jgi:hypothetical protein
MLDVLFWIVFSLVLLIVIPDRWDARRKIARGENEKGASSSGRTGPGSSRKYHA